MNEVYKPPYQLTDEMLEIVYKIITNLGKINNTNDLDKMPKLRKINRIISIHSSLAIENNSLSLDEVANVLDGKVVLGNNDDIKAVINAKKAYSELDNINPFNMDDLFKVHKIMMDGLVKEAGKIRKGYVGVVNEKGEVIHLAPPSELVYKELTDLFNWIKNSKAHILIKSSIFHYEFEFIHPFSDGNGRMGRLWQIALLSFWHPIFKWIPIESIIYDNQNEYYEALRSSNNEALANNFMMFMLNAIDKAIEKLIKDTSNHINSINNQVTKLLKVMDHEPLSANELMNRLNLKSRVGLKRNYIDPALDLGLIEMEIKDKPTSKNQKYRKKTINR